MLEYMEQQISSEVEGYKGLMKMEVMDLLWAGDEYGDMELVCGFFLIFSSFME